MPGWGQSCCSQRVLLWFSCSGLVSLPSPFCMQRQTKAPCWAENNTGGLCLLGHWKDDFTTGMIFQERGRQQGCRSWADSTKGKMCYTTKLPLLQKEEATRHGRLLTCTVGGLGREGDMPPGMAAGSAQVCWHKIDNSDPGQFRRWSGDFHQVRQPKLGCQPQSKAATHLLCTPLS